ncbi:vicilin-like seed storage protein At2g18540 [Selaginella moellendorffii]|uniref:vicilin-like seed storage protein At2g18540 n=1 Tax=Selaginella moellendorffii TaxID=88036 RepID=UPI000D1CE4D2|nr:vicilin-like seed storage protein At2g18540 [Selaginella moellendorffii]|eukprot:XP_002960340.2 vicilin-like seed storage protein At2g18540 [Selaginella moellendorffii]
MEHEERDEGGKRGRRRKRRHEESDSRSRSSDSGSSESENRRSKRRKRHHRRRTRGSSDSSSSGEESDSDVVSKRSRSRVRHKEERRHKSRDKEKKRKDRGKGKRKEEKKKKKKEKAERQKSGPVTASWGKYGLIKEIDMWNKRPEFSAWLSEVKKVNLETLPNWEERQMFKEYMEDYNTATLPSKKYYNVDKYHQRKMFKEWKKGAKYRSVEVERTEFNDEEQRRQELKMLREHEKEAHIEELKHSMKTGMAQAMREQAQLREEMQYQYRLGNLEAANAIQKRLEPDAL